MKLYCRYCGYCVEYDNGIGWFPGYAQKLVQHILDEHIRISTREKKDENGVLVEIEYSAYTDPSYSGQPVHKHSAAIHRPQELPAWTMYYEAETGPENGSQTP